MVPGQPLETGVHASDQVLVVHEEVLEQFEPRSVIHRDDRRA
jgi:hypothetical protein